MGSGGSRSRRLQVAPRPPDLCPQVSRPEPVWTLPPLTVTREEPPRLHEKKRTKLPPLKLTGNVSTWQSNNVSIIYSHPPKTLQDWTGGDVQQLSALVQAGRPGTSRTARGCLEAQLDQNRLYVRHRQALVQRSRERTTTNTGERSRRPVRRPTERDVLWDQTSGRRLDLSTHQNTQRRADRLSRSPVEQNRI